MTYEAGRGGRVAVANSFGLSTAVSITAASGRAITVYTNAARTVSVAMPDTTTTTKQYYLDRDDAYVISVQVNSTECGMAGTHVTPATQYISGDTTEWVSVDRELAQETAASGPVWTAFPVPTTLAGGWDTGDAQGTWVDNGDGTVSQTDNTIFDRSILTTADLRSSAYWMESRVRIDAEVDPDTGAEIGLFADCPIPGGSFEQPTGLYISFVTGPPLDGTVSLFFLKNVDSGPNNISVAVGDWHTYLWVLDGTRLFFYLDGVLVDETWPKPIELPQHPLAASRIALYCSGAATFDLNATKVAYKPVPTTFPA